MRVRIKEASEDDNIRAEKYLTPFNPPLLTKERGI
jgi:hypothetical protein